MIEADRYDICWLDSVESTNDQVKLTLDSLKNLSVLAAHNQTSGRGQRGHTWLTEPGLNLTFSVVLKYDEALLQVEAINQVAISQLTASTMVDLLSEYGINAKIKLPNDIYVGTDKICGILIENTIRGKYLLYSIIGIGLNVNQTVFDPSLPNPTSMRLCLPSLDQDLDLEAILEKFMEIFIRHLHQTLKLEL